jgi:hypothetical protein
MKRFLLPVIALIFTVFLVAMLSFSAGGALASSNRTRPKPTPTPSPTPSNPQGVSYQVGSANLNPGGTFCLPAQQVAGIQGGQVEGGGFSFVAPGAPPIDTQWTAYNGPTASSLQAIHTVKYSFVVMKDTVPIGSFYRVCMTNITNVVVSFGIQRSEYTNDPPFP